MKLGTLLSAQQIVPDMKAGTHWDALAELADHLVQLEGADAGEKEAILSALHAREEQVSTGIGHGVAIPHAYCSKLAQTVVLLGRSQDGIDFEALDNAPVHFVILLLVADHERAMHLQTLASIARLFSRGDVRQRLRAADGAGELLETVRSCESEPA
jgi:mannitol/fructose-specific phosphotransferase system IIA component (Ntr-type)